MLLDESLFNYDSTIYHESVLLVNDFQVSPSLNDHNTPLNSNFHFPTRIQFCWRQDQRAQDKKIDEDYCMVKNNKLGICIIGETFVEGYSEKCW